MRMKQKILVIVPTLMLFITSTSWAVKPYSETFVSDDDLWIVNCGDYDVRTYAPTRIKSTEFYDKNGDPIAVHLSGHVLESTYYNSVDDSIYIRQGAKGVGEGFQWWLDLITGDEKVTGANYRITLPGVGPLMIFTGRWYWEGGNFYRSGASIFPEEGTGSALCEALAP